MPRRVITFMSCIAGVCIAVLSVTKPLKVEASWRQLHIRSRRWRNHDSHEYVSDTVSASGITPFPSVAEEVIVGQNVQLQIFPIAQRFYTDEQLSHEPRQEPMYDVKPVIFSRRNSPHSTTDTAVQSGTQVTLRPRATVPHAEREPTAAYPPSPAPAVPSVAQHRTTARQNNAVMHELGVADNLVEEERKKEIQDDLSDSPVQLPNDSEAQALRSEPHAHDSTEDNNHEYTDNALNPLDGQYEKVPSDVEVSDSVPRVSENSLLVDEDDVSTEDSREKAQDAPQDSSSSLAPSDGSQLAVPLTSESLPVEPAVETLEAIVQDERSSQETEMISPVDEGGLLPFDTESLRRSVPGSGSVVPSQVLSVNNSSFSELKAVHRESAVLSSPDEEEEVKTAVTRMMPEFVENEGDFEQAEADEERMDINEMTAEETVPVYDGSEESVGARMEQMEEIWDYGIPSDAMTPASGSPVRTVSSAASLEQPTYSVGVGEMRERDSHAYNYELTGEPIVDFVAAEEEGDDAALTSELNPVMNEENADSVEHIAMAPRAGTAEEAVNLPGETSLDSREQDDVTQVASIAVFQSSSSPMALEEVLMPNLGDSAPRVTTSGAPVVAGDALVQVPETQLLSVNTEPQLDSAQVDETDSEELGRISKALDNLALSDSHGMNKLESGDVVPPEMLQDASPTRMEMEPVEAAPEASDEQSDVPFAGEELFVDTTDVARRETSSPEPQSVKKVEGPLAASNPLFPNEASAPQVIERIRMQPSDRLDVEEAAQPPVLDSEPLEISEQFASEPLTVREEIEPNPRPVPEVEENQDDSTEDVLQREAVETGEDVSRIIRWQVDQYTQETAQDDAVPFPSGPVENSEPVSDAGHQSDLNDNFVTKPNGFVRDESFEGLHSISGGAPPGYIDLGTLASEEKGILEAAVEGNIDYLSSAPSEKEIDEGVISSHTVATGRESEQSLADGKGMASVEDVMDSQERAADEIPLPVVTAPEEVQDAASRTPSLGGPREVRASNDQPLRDASTQDFEDVSEGDDENLLLPSDDVPFQAVAEATDSWMPFSVYETALNHLAFRAAGDYVALPDYAFEDGALSEEFSEMIQGAQMREAVPEEEAARDWNADSKKETDVGVEETGIEPHFSLRGSGSAAAGEESDVVAPDAIPPKLNGIISAGHTVRNPQVAVLNARTLR